MGNCNHRKYIPHLGSWWPGTFHPLQVLPGREPPTHVIEACRPFDLLRPAWVKVELRPAAP
jgi:hypothetical protein